MNCTIPIPLATQVAALSATWAEWKATRNVAARISAERRTRVLEPHIGLWLDTLASASEPLGMCDMRARFGTVGLTKSQLTRSVAVALERGHARIAYRGRKNAAFYVITVAGRLAVAEKVRSAEVRR